MADIIKLVVVLVVFIVIMYLAYRASKLVGGSRFGGKKGKNIDLVESRAVGINSGVQLIKVGTGYFLIGVTRDKITLLSEIDKETLDVAEEEQSGHGMPLSSAFGKVFADKLQAFKKNKNDGKHD